MTHVTNGRLRGLSDELAEVVASVKASVVRVDDGSRLTATGLIWSDDGLIVTTSHGVERDHDLTVELADGTRLEATLVGREPDTDIALLRVSATGLSAIRPAESQEVKVGHLVLAVAHPGNSGIQATQGIISSRLDSQNQGQEEYLLHTDAQLFPGFSGGALVGMSGTVVGMTNLLFGRGKGVALGIPVVQNIVNALLTTGRVQRGYLGISTQQAIIPSLLRSSQNIVQEHGLLIVQVEPGTGAERGGLFMGDTLLKLNGQPVGDVDHLRQSLRSLSAGQTIDLQIIRSGELCDLQVTLGTVQ